MKTITINGKKYSTPENWNEITLETQIRVNDYMETFTNERIKSMAMMAGYLNIPIDELKRMKLTDANKLAKHVSFLNKPIESQAQTQFDFNGETYYVGQNLLETEFQDFVSIQNTMQNVSGNTLTVLPTIIAIMAKRKKACGTLESLDDYDVEARSKEFLQVPITVANNLSVFFYQSINVLHLTTHLYSNPKALAQRKIEECRNTVKQQGGRGLLIRWLRGTSLYYLRFIEKRLDKYFTS